MMRISTLVGLVTALALALAGCTRPGVTAYKVKERRTALVLVSDGAGGCLAKTADRHNAYKGDTVIWQVYSYCDAAKSVELRFTKLNPLEGIRTSNPLETAHRFQDISGSVTGDPGLYPYEVWVNGSRVADPDLEIDPFD